MRKKLTALLALLLAFALLFAACAPEIAFNDGFSEKEASGETLYDTTVEPTDNTPADTRANAPPEETDAAGAASSAVASEADVTESAAPATDASETEAATETAAAAAIDENGVYTSKEDVALYIHIYGKLPQNFITKQEARALGWRGGSLEPYAPGKCIGGDVFKNTEKHITPAPGRTFTECDIDTLGAKSRGAKRIVFSNDGLIYYTDNHYNTFTLLYGEE